MPNITYPIATTSLTSKKINNIHDVLLPTVITSQRFNIHWPKQLRYGQHKYSDIRLLDLEVKQGIRKIQIIHNFLHHPKHRTLIHAIVDWYQISTRPSQSVFKSPHQRSNYVSSVLVKNLIFFKVRNKIQVVLDNALQFNIQHRNDKYIMDKLTKESLSLQQLIHLITCRLYLNIHT